jgi:hypothetical protein
VGFIDCLIDVAVRFHNFAVLEHMRPLRAGGQLEEMGGASAAPAPWFAVSKFDLQTFDPNGSLSGPHFDYETLPRRMGFARVLTDPPRVDARTVPERLHCDERRQEPNRSKNPGTGDGKRVDSGSDHIGNLAPARLQHGDPQSPGFLNLTNRSGCRNDVDRRRGLDLSLVYRDTIVRGQLLNASLYDVLAEAVATSSHVGETTITRQKETLDNDTEAFELEHPASFDAGL